MCGTLCRYAFISCLIHSVWSQGTAQLTFSSNPVYSQELVTLTCSWVSGVVLIDVTVEAFDVTLKKGYLSCTATSRTCASGIGVFNGISLNGWSISIGMTNVSLTLTAVPSLELNYSCTAKVTNTTVIYSMTSEPAYLQVRVRPAVPQLKPIPLAFTNNAVVQCDSLDAKPAAIVRLTVRSTKGMELTSTDLESTSLMLSPPLINWHNATAICTLMNHNFSNMTTTSIITIHRSTLLTVSSNPVYSGEPVHLTCSYNTADPLFAATIDALNRTQKEGSLTCNTLSVSRIGTGVFEGKILDECSRSLTSTNVTLWMTASPLLELDFNCTVTINLDDRSLLELTSATVSLMVHVLPEVPKFLPNSLVFQVPGSATVACESRNGNPSAVVNLTISAPSGNRLTAVGTEYVLLNLSVPVDWHNAKAMCTVMNHMFPNLSTTSTIMINHGSLRCEKCWIFGPIMGGIIFVVIIILSLLYKLGHFSCRRKRKSSGLEGSQKQALVVNPNDTCVRDVMLLREGDEENSSDRKLASAEAPYATLFAETKCDRLAYESLLL